MLPQMDTFITDNFIPRDFQVELYESAKIRNTVVCLNSDVGKTFIAVMLVRDKAQEVIRPMSQGGLRTVFLTPTVSLALQQSAYLRHHTPLKVGIFHKKKGVEHWSKERWIEEFEKSQILVMTYHIFLSVLQQDLLKISQINLLILDDCHNVVGDSVLEGLLHFSNLPSASLKPRVLGLTSSIINNKCNPIQLSRIISSLERSLKSNMHTSNSVLSALQHLPQPRELICETKSLTEASDLEKQIMERVLRVTKFLQDHRYDPSEYYGDQDYLKEIPNPCSEPVSILEEFSYVVETFGPWGADRAALVYLIHVEKLKTRAVYERHYLLLCLVFTLLLEIRSICEEVFQNYTENDRIVKFSRPKVLRLLEILRLYKPYGSSRSEKKEAGLEAQPSHESNPTDESDESQKQPQGGTESVENSEPVPTVAAVSPAPVSTHFSRRRRADFVNRHHRYRDDQHQLCGIIFVNRRTTAKFLYHLLKDASRCDPALAYLSPLYTFGRAEGMSTKEVESEERKQEDVMKRFRSRDCNILVATSVLEEGIDVPACHLVIRYDLPQSYSAYVHSKARARARKAHYVLMAEDGELESFMGDLAQFHATEQMLLRKCGYHNLISEYDYPADVLNRMQAPYKSMGTHGSSVSLQNSIAIVNKYCAKLPSDSFTRLAPVWEIRSTDVNLVEKSIIDVWISWFQSRYSDSSTPRNAYQCSLQLPINSPLRQTVWGLVMPTKSLAKRSVALEACQLLRQLEELDDNFLPVGKENLRLEEEEDYNADLEDENVPESNPRPGTTKRRQYYYKQVADPFTKCMPEPSVACYLYAITMVLTEPIPEEQNTRGRKIYKPETSTQSLGILSKKPMPQICPFPIFTRSGEVEVDVVQIEETVAITSDQLERISHFQRYIFRNVLALEKDPMLFDPANADCSYLIVPLRRNETKKFTLDFSFVDHISAVRDTKPRFIPDEERAGYAFDPRKYQDTVVLRWYRDQEHPQCFYVAEIFYELNPQSKFPDNNYPTFEQYYRDKYGIQIQNLKQPLLDVDHTSARLNFLTPRYVNRKGVMLPTSSEHTKKTQRESLQQKQILVPELCSIHPFTASLWRQAVCLPCILYRLNGLLLAEKLRCQVASEIYLGKADLDVGFRWPPLRFGWKRKSATSTQLAVTETKEESSEAANPKEHIDDVIVATQAIKAPIRNVKKNVFKDAKKSDGGAMMSIGVWNPDAVDGNAGGNGDGEGGNDEYYDYNDLQAVALLTDDNVADFDWNKKIVDPSVTNGSLSTFNVGPSSELGSWDDPNVDGFSQLRPKSPSEFMNDYSDGGSYNSDQSLEDSSSDSDETSSDDEDNCKTKEFGPRLVFRGDTAEAVEETGTSKLKKNKSPEEEEIEDGALDEEEENKMADDLLTLSSQWSSDAIDQDLEARCQELLNRHREGLMKENFIPKNRDVPIVPPFANKVGDLESDHRHSAESRKASLEKATRLASQSPYMLELAGILLGPDVHANEPEGKVEELCVEGVHVEHEAHVIGSDFVYPIVDFGFSFDEQPDLENHPGPSPSIILQAFTMSSANDGINLERLETIGDSFLKYAITTYLYCKYGSIHEGKLSYLRSRQVSNLHLYQLGKKKLFGGCMVATKFNPHDNWLPPGYVIPDALEEALITSGVPLNYWNVVDLQGMEQLSSEQVRALVKEKTEQILSRFGGKIPSVDDMVLEGNICLAAQDMPRFVPYNLLTQHSIPDKSIADCVEALIGAYLTACGPRGALLFMSWLGLKVLPTDPERKEKFGYWMPPVSPILNWPSDAPAMLNQMLAGFDSFEEKIGYRFNDRYYLLQAFSHASYYPNRLTDCYQRLEFLGDAVLDYLITRYLYEDPRQHPPGALTDLRSALVNNTTFAVLAVRYEFHRYFKHFSHTLNQVMDKFIKAQEENGHCINEEYYLIEEGESEEAEDVEVPKALGDVFESVAGAIYLDSKMSLDAVWNVYYRMMKKEIDEFSKNVPKSPIRELLELETDRVKFGKAERLPDGRVRVTVDVIGKGTFKGIGRNYRIAKCTAAKFALRTLEKRRMLTKRGEQ